MYVIVSNGRNWEAHRKTVLWSNKKIAWHLPGRTGTDQEKLSNRIIDLQVETQKIKGVNQTH
jgi:hypothetical protein